MSATGNPVHIVWVIRQNPHDEASLFAMPVDDCQVGLFLFTQREYAEDFTRNSPDMAAGAVVAFIEVPDLARVLAEQAQRGRTHVVTDPVLGSSSYLDQHTLTISEYLSRLAV